MTRKLEEPGSDEPDGEVAGRSRMRELAAELVVLRQRLRLGGGAERAARQHEQGKVMSSALLRLELDVPDEVAAAAAGRGRMPAGEIR